MGCAGPSQTGHPLAGQTVKVFPAPAPAPAPAPTTNDLGFTGSAAHAIAVRFPSPTVRPAVLPCGQRSTSAPAWVRVTGVAYL
jgi:hypothetical protein